MISAGFSGLSLIHSDIGTKMINEAAELSITIKDEESFYFCGRNMHLIMAFFVSSCSLGGYTDQNVPFVHYSRSKELFLRWSEFGAFTTVRSVVSKNKP